MHSGRSREGILSRMKHGYIALRGPEYIQTNIQCCIREIRQKMTLLSLTHALSLCPDIERKIDELRELVAMFHKATAQHAGEGMADRQIAHHDLHRKAGLYHKNQKRLSEQYSMMRGIEEGARYPGSSGEHPSPV